MQVQVAGLLDEAAVEVVQAWLVENVAAGQRLWLCTGCVPEKPVDVRAGRASSGPYQREAGTLMLVTSKPYRWVKAISSSMQLSIPRLCAALARTR